MNKKLLLCSCVLASLGLATEIALAAPEDVKKACNPTSQAQKADTTTIYWIRFVDEEGNFNTATPLQAQTEIGDLDALNIIAGPGTGKSLVRDKSKAYLKGFTDKAQITVTGSSNTASHFDFSFPNSGRHKIYLVALPDNWEFSTYDGSDPSSLSFQVKNRHSDDNFCELVVFGKVKQIPANKVARFFFDPDKKEKEHEFALNMFVRQRDASGTTLEYETKVTIDPKIINNGP